jgi:hypothetical protein
MKPIRCAFAALALAVLACSLPFFEGQPIPLEPVREVSQPGASGLLVQFDGYQFVIPPGLAAGFQVNTYPEVAPDGDDHPYWDIAPAHVEFLLEGYTLADTFHQPRILVYPASRYAELHSGASTSIERIEALISDVPFFNAGAIINAKLEMIRFGNGMGVRTITQYAQAANPINNHELFYLYEGLTDDRRYLVIVILPINQSLLSNSSDPYAVVPPGGFVFPDWNNPQADFAAYYLNITELLDNLGSDDFQPSLAELDRLVQSIVIQP